jgi:hypothetical protein
VFFSWWWLGVVGDYRLILALVVPTGLFVGILAMTEGMTNRKLLRFCYDVQFFFRIGKKSSGTGEGGGGKSGNAEKLKRGGEEKS